MFPLLKLPLLCIQNVADLWELIELYEFSCLSKRAKKVSKRKKIELEVYLDIHSRSMRFKKEGVHISEWTLNGNRYIVNREGIPSLNRDITLFLQATQHFLDIFNCPFEQIDIQLNDRLTDYQLIRIIDWMNGLKTEIIGVWIHSANWSMFNMFMALFQKSVRLFYITETEFRENEIVPIRLNFEIKDIFHSDPWFNLDFLLSMDTEQIAANNIDLSEEDLNMFLRSWQEGKTNQGLRVCKLTVDFFDVRKVLKDCGGQLMDPRTTKLKFPKLGKYGFIDDVWIRGGIHIRRNDGRLAVIQTNNYVYWREGEGAREEDVKEYLRNLEIWNSENRRFVRERVFNFYIF